MGHALLVDDYAALTALLEWPARRLAPFLVVLFVTFIGIPVLLQVRNGRYLWPSGRSAGLVGWIIAFTRGTAAARASGAVPRRRNFATSASANINPRRHSPSDHRQARIGFRWAVKSVKSSCCSAIWKASPR